MAFKKLTQAELDAALAGLRDWAVIGGKLHKTYRFADFVEAFGFMSRAALVAERMDHHPEWFNVYSQVRVDLTTHEAQGLTQSDIDLATAMDRLAGQ